MSRHSSDLEIIGRSTEIEAPVIPVRHEDLKALVGDLDQTRTALIHRGLSEADLEQLVSPASRNGEPYSMTAARIIRDQLAEIEELERLHSDASQELAEARLELARLKSDPLDASLSALGFAEER